MFGHFYLKISALLVSLAITTIWISFLTKSPSPRTTKSLIQKAPDPELIIGRINKNATFIFGIPHIHRDKQNYVIATLDSLLQNVPGSRYNEVSYAILIADSDQRYTRGLIQFISKKFEFYINRGLLQIIVPPSNFYPDTSALPTNQFFFGGHNKFLWTVKQNYDYAYLMKYCSGLGKYYIQLEDDVTTHQAYIQGLEAGLRKGDLDPRWFVIEYSSLGFIGKMFHSEDMDLIANFLLTFHAYKPVDWLLGYLLPIIACRPEENNKQCNDRVQRIRYHYTPSLFQHTGQFSSLKGKIQLLQDTEYVPIVR